MAKPRQEFLGPITKLAAYEYNGSWISDPSGIVDGYGAEITNILGIYNPYGHLTISAGNTLTNGYLFLKNKGILNTTFSIGDDGVRTKNYGALEMREYTTYNSSNVPDGHIIHCAENRMVSVAKDGYGTYTFVPNNVDSSTTRHDKQFGAFRLIGSGTIKTLTFSTNIHGFEIPAYTAFMGKFRLGWIGNNHGWRSAGAAIEFLIIGSTNSSGNISMFSISTKGGHDGYLVINSDTCTPYASAPPEVPEISTSYTSNDFSIVIRASSNSDNPLDAMNADFYWELEYGWGTY